MKKLGVVLLASLFLGVSFAQANILPENDLWKVDGFNVGLGLSEAEFNEAIDEVLKVYEPIIRSFGANLEVVRLWEHPDVNATALMRGKNWFLTFYGGLARRPEINKDGMQLVVCHEIGHLIGGFPFKSHGASVEGQSDYFATQECIRRVWSHQPSSIPLSADGDHPIVRKACDQSWSGRGDQEHCYRTAGGSMSLARLMGALTPEPTVPSFEQHDPNKVSVTYVKHPAAQCRLDTLLSAAYCTAQFDVARVPGRGHANGQDSLGAETEMTQTSCAERSGFEVGLRPRCWFFPRM